MRKAELIREVAAATGMTVTATEKIVNATFEIIKARLVAGGEVNVTNFGKFAVVNRKERRGVNPKTHSPMTIEGRKFPVFRAGTGLKTDVRA